MSYIPPLHKKIYHKTKRFLAKLWLNINNPYQIGITGSQGKTNTSTILYKILSEKYNTTITDTNLDTKYNVPITALKIRPQTQYAIFELGIDTIDEMDKHLEIVQPQIGIITAISSVHTDEEHLKSLDLVIQEKGKLLKALPSDGLAILNWDDKNVQTMKNLTKAPIQYFGTNKRKCKVTFTDLKITLKGTSFTLHPQNKEPLQINTKLYGSHHAYNIMAVYLVAKHLNISDKDFKNTIESIKPLSGRMSPEKGPKNTLILNDGLRANPQSTKSGLKTLSLLKYSKGRKIAVLNEMGELQHPKQKHKEIGEYTASLKNIDYLISIGPLQKFTAEAAEKSGMNSEKIIYVKNVIEAAQKARKILKKGDIVYLKGSLLRHSERFLIHLENEDVKCQVNLCDRYKLCYDCPYLKKGHL